MKTRLAPIALAVGILLSLVGFWWLWTGLDIVQVERGWSAVIAGATMLSAGLVIAVLSAILFRLGEIAEALGAGPRRAAAVASALAGPPIAERSPSASPAPESDASSDGKSPAQDARKVVGRHVSGDSTYVMFADGSVEAHTPEGVLHFASLDELRAYASEREASSETS